MNIKERLKYIRNNLNLSQKKFAEFLEWDYKQIENIERGKLKKFPHELAYKIQVKLGYSLNWLLTGEGEIKQPEAKNINPLAEWQKKLDLTESEMDILEKAIAKHKYAVFSFIKEKLDI